MGGTPTNINTEVLDADNNVVPGLMAIGRGHVYQFMELID